MQLPYIVTAQEDSSADEHEDRAAGPAHLQACLAGLWVLMPALSFKNHKGALPQGGSSSDDDSHRSRHHDPPQRMAALRRDTQVISTGASGQAQLVL